MIVSYACMSMTHVCAKETRRGQWVSWDWNHKHLWVSNVVLGIEPQSYGRTVSTLNCWVYLSSPLSLNLEFDGSAGLVRTNLFLPLQCWDYRHKPLCPAFYEWVGNKLFTISGSHVSHLTNWATMPKPHLKYIIAKFDKNPKGSLRIWESMRIKFKKF